MRKFIERLLRSSGKLRFAVARWRREALLSSQVCRPTPRERPAASLPTATQLSFLDRRPPRRAGRAVSRLPTAKESGQFARTANIKAPRQL